MNSSPDWKLVWSDEFDYNGLPNSKKWDYEVGKIRNNEAQYYTKARKENARVEDGKLIIEGRKEEYKGSHYTAASLITLGKFSFQYGRVEVRAKLPKARGTWPAIWMMGEDHPLVGWPRCGEIDIMEHVGFNPGFIHGTIHQINDEKKHWSKGEIVKVPDCTDAFHTYGLEWSKEGLTIFIDDNRYFEFPYQGPGKWTFDRKMYLLINLAIGGQWGGANGIDEAAYPQRYEIDYVRVYQRK
jgi:beta-glucanase (GH16 family)